MIRTIAIECLLHRLRQMNGKSHGGFLEFKASLESPTIVLAFREVFRLERNRRKPYCAAWQGFNIRHNTLLRPTRAMRCFMVGYY